MDDQRLVLSPIRPAMSLLHISLTANKRPFSRDQLRGRPGCPSRSILELPRILPHKLPGAGSASGNLNPALLWLGQYGHWAQSHKLGISDAWGFFSPGHARLQVAQASMFFVFIIILGPAIAAFSLPCIVLSIAMGWYFETALMTAVLVVAWVGIWWVMLSRVPEARI